MRFLYQNWGGETSENLTTFIEEKIRSEMENNTFIFATKTDLFSVKESLSADLFATKGSFSADLFATKESLSADLFATKESLSADLFAVKEELVEKISAIENKVTEQRADLIKWMFLFWVGQLAAMFGLVLLFLKK